MTMALQRTVLVLGRTAPDSTRLFPDDLDGSIALVVIAIGWPMTETQRAIVDEALALARKRAIVFDAILAGSIAEGVAVVAARDRVLVAGGRREARRIERSLRHARDQRSRRAMTWMSIASALRISSFTNEPRRSSWTRDRRDSPTTSCVTNWA